MPSGLIDSAARNGQRTDRRVFGITLGMVVNNVDLAGMGRVQVHVSGLDVRPWARVAGTDNGTFFMPQIGDEVPVVFRNGDVREAFVLGALWNALNRPPTLNPLDAVTKRILRSLLGHKIEFDDLTQTVTIQNSTLQEVTLDPSRIEASTVGGAARVTLYSTGDVSIEAAKSISLAAPTININGGTININGSAATTINGGGACTIQAALVTIN
jgi:phage baseplate assembly protein V